jgi:hypothetical protein
MGINGSPGVGETSENLFMISEDQIVLRSLGSLVFQGLLNFRGFHLQKDLAGIFSPSFCPVSVNVEEELAGRLVKILPIIPASISHGEDGHRSTMKDWGNLFKSRQCGAWAERALGFKGLWVQRFREFLSTFEPFDLLTQKL